MQVLLSTALRSTCITCALAVFVGNKLIHTQRRPPRRNERGAWYYDCDVCMYVVLSPQERPEEEEEEDADAGYA
jgi:hypothetical protein